MYLGSCRSRHAPHPSPPQAAASSDALHCHPVAETCPSPSPKARPQKYVPWALATSTGTSTRCRHHSSKIEIHVLLFAHSNAADTNSGIPLQFIQLDDARDRAPRRLWHCRPAPTSDTKLAAAWHRQQHHRHAAIPHAAQSPSNRGDDVHVRLGLGATDPYRPFMPIAVRCRLESSPEPLTLPRRDSPASEDASDAWRAKRPTFVSTLLRSPQHRR